MASGNYSRAEDLTYPDTSVIDYLYGSAGSASDLISRVVKLGPSAGGDYTQYEFMGLGVPAIIDYVTPDVQMDRTAKHTGERQYASYTDNPGLYPGFDRYGRVVRHMWVDGQFTTHATSGSVPKYPSIIEHLHTYDKVSNRLTATDGRVNASQPIRDREFTYDELYRLTESKRGASGGGFTHGGDSQKWVLDAIGNWGAVWTDADGDGSYSDSARSLKQTPRSKV